MLHGRVGSARGKREGKEIKWGGWVCAYLAGRKNGTRREEEERAVTDSRGRERETPFTSLSPLCSPTKNENKPLFAWPKVPRPPFSDIPHPFSIGGSQSRKNQSFERQMLSGRAPFPHFRCRTQKLRVRIKFNDAKFPTSFKLFGRLIKGSIRRPRGAASECTKVVREKLAWRRKEMEV